jgi:titin
VTGGGSLVLVEGRTYRLKYSSTNVAGEGALSDEVSILLAEVPDPPQNLRRIGIQELPAGEIRIQWDLPAEDGGTPITGYVIYLDDVVYYATTSGDSTLNEFSLTSLNVGRTYKIAVGATNAIGGGQPAEVSLLAASLPPKLPMPDFHSATSSSITVNASLPTYTGGSPVLSFVYRRNDGPLTEFEAQVPQTTNLNVPKYDFTGLAHSKRIYRFQMAATNAIGQGPWSEAVSYRATSPPDNPTLF